MSTAQPGKIVKTPLQPLPRSDYERFDFRHRGFVTEMANLRADAKHRLALLASGSPHDRRSRVRGLLRDRKLAVLYTYEALRDSGRLGTASPESITALAIRCTPFAPSREHVCVREVVKRGKRRTVYDFGPIKRAQQLLVSKVIRALHPPRPEQFLFNRGMPEALRSIETAFREGFTHAMEIDIVGFYASIGLDRLAEALHPLPDAVVRHVVWDSASRCASSVPVAVQVAMRPPPLNGLDGLPLGAATSPIVGERIIGLLLADANLPEGTKVITYADNLFVLGRTERDVAAGADHLGSLAERLPTGPLRTRASDIRVFDPETAPHRASIWGVEFANQIGTVEDGCLSWAPNPEKLIEHSISDLPGPLSLEQIAHAERQVSQWRRAYTYWQQGAAWEAAKLAELAAARFYLLAEPAHLTAACHALTIAYLAEGRVRMPEEYLPDGDTELRTARRDQILRETRSLLGRFSVQPS